MGSVRANTSRAVSSGGNRGILLPEGEVLTGKHYRARFVSLRRLLRWLAALDVLASVGLIVFLVAWPRITIFVTIASVVAALVIVLLAIGLRMVFRDLPELEVMSTKFDEEAGAHKDRQVGDPKSLLSKIAEVAAARSRD